MIDTKNRAGTRPTILVIDPTVCSVDSSNLIMILVPCGIRMPPFIFAGRLETKKNQQRNLSVLEILHKNLPISRTYPGTICSIRYPADTYFVQDFGGFVNGVLTISLSNF